MSKKIIISDTNIIIYLGVDGVLEAFCKQFSVFVTEDVVDEINNGRASRIEAKEIFYKAYNQGQIQITQLTNDQKILRDELMGRKTKIGKGEASSIAVVYDEISYIFATNDNRALDVAKDLLESQQVVCCDDILAALAGIISTEDIKKIEKLINE